MKELKKQIQELLRAYRDFQDLVPSGRDKKDDLEESKTSIETRLGDKAALATQTLEAMFPEALSKAPETLTSVEFKKAVKTMVIWASQVIPSSQGIPSSHVEESFETAELCSSRLGELSSETIQPSSGLSQIPWPFVQKLRVFLKAHVLSKGLILTDLPGLRDLNHARRAIAEGYVRQCHQVFAVLPIARGSTDQSVKEIIDLADNVKLSKVDIVFTRLDDFQISEAGSDWPKHKAEIEELEGNRKFSTAMLQKLSLKIGEMALHEASLNSDQKEKLMKLRATARDAEIMEEKSTRELKGLIIGLRNAEVSSQVKKQYQDHRMAATLKTFCISNQMYWSHRDEDITSSLPYLTMSGILEVRRYCIGIVADSQFQAATEYIKDQVPAFLGSVQLWIDAGSRDANAERKQHMLDRVDALQQALRKVSRSCLLR